MDVAKDLLMQYLDKDQEVGILNQEVIDRTIEALQKIIQYDAPGSKSEERQRGKAESQKLLLFFQKFDVTRSSHTTIKLIFETLIQISTKYDVFDYWAISSKTDLLTKVLVILAARNLRNSKSAFELMKEMLDSVFGAEWFDRFSLDTAAQSFIAGIVNEFCEQRSHRHRLLHEDKKDKLCEMVQNLLKHLLHRDDKMRFRLASTFLKDCESLKTIIYKIFHRVLTSGKIPKNSKDLFRSKESVSDVLIELCGLVPSTVQVFVMPSIQESLQIKSKRKDGLMIVFELVISTISCEELRFLWDTLKNQYVGKKAASEEDMLVLHEYSPSLLNTKFGPEWLDILIQLIKQSCKIMEQSKLLKTISRAGIESPAFFFDRKIQSVISSIVYVGSIELKECLREYLLRCLCEVYLDYLANESLIEARGLQNYLLSNIHYDMECLPEDWALARVLICVMTVRDKSPPIRAWHLALFHAFCRTDEGGCSAVREAYRNTPAVSRSMHQLLSLVSADEEKRAYLSRHLLSEIQSADKPSHAVKMKSIVNKACDIIDFRQDLKKLTSCENDTTIKRKNKIRTCLKFYKGEGPAFLEKFYSTIEPLVKYSEMKILLTYITQKLNPEAANLDYEIIPLPADISLTDLVYTVHESIVRCPHLAFHPDTLSVLCKLCTYDDEDVSKMAMACISTALNCGCSVGRRNDENHGRWTAEEKEPIRSLCLEGFGLISPALQQRGEGEGETLVNWDYRRKRSYLKGCVRITETILTHQEILALTQDMKNCLEKPDQTVYELTVAALGFMAANKYFNDTFKMEIWEMMEQLWKRIIDNLYPVVNVDEYSEIEWERLNVPQSLRIILEEYRSLGRCMQFCIPGANTEKHEFVIHVLADLSASVPLLQRRRAENQLGETDARLQNDACCSAGLIRLEAACAVLSACENPVIRYGLPTEIIIALAQISMDPVEQLRDTFIRKLNRGLCFIRNWSTDSGKTKGKLHSLLAALIPMRSLCPQDRFSDKYFESEYYRDVHQTAIQLITFAKSQRHFMYRLQNSDEHVSGDRVPYVLPELFPEFILCWLVPILAKLPLMSWFRENTQLPSLSERQKGLLKLILNCYQIVLTAVNDPAAFVPKLPVKVVRRLPQKMLKFMKSENGHERQRQIVLCALLNVAITCSNHYNEHGRKGKRRKKEPDYPVNLILLKGKLFYDVNVPRDDHIDIDGKSKMVNSAKKLSEALMQYGTGTGTGISQQNMKIPPTVHASDILASDIDLPEPAESSFTPRSERSARGSPQSSSGSGQSQSRKRGWPTLLGSLESPKVQRRRFTPPIRTFGQENTVGVDSEGEQRFLPESPGQESAPEESDESTSSEGVVRRLIFDSPDGESASEIQVAENDEQGSDSDEISDAGSEDSICSAVTVLVEEPYPGEQERSIPSSAESQKSDNGRKRRQRPTDGTARPPKKAKNQVVSSTSLC